MMLSANFSLSASFPWNKTQYNLLLDSLCKTFYVIEAYRCGKQLFLSFVAKLIPEKFGVDPMLPLKAPEGRPAHWIINFDFLLPVVEQIVSFSYSPSVFWNLVTNRKLWSVSFSSERGCFWIQYSLAQNSWIESSYLRYCTLRESCSGTVQKVLCRFSGAALPCCHMLWIFSFTCVLERVLCSL